MRPSPTQLGVLIELYATGGRLERWPGGFWTTPGRESRDLGAGRIPNWSVGTNTVRAMTKAGWLEAEPGHPEWCAPRRLTEAGLALVPR